MASVEGVLIPSVVRTSVGPVARWSKKYAELSSALQNLSRQHSGHRYDQHQEIAGSEPYRNHVDNMVVAAAVTSSR